MILLQVLDDNESDEDDLHENDNILHGNDDDFVMTIILMKVKFQRR